MPLDVKETNNYLRDWSDYHTKQLVLQERLNDQCRQAGIELKYDEKLLKATKRARDILIAATAATQDQVREYIEELVSLALQSVFGMEYFFILEFQEKRGQSEIKPTILWKQEKFSPRDEVGGGVVDIASFALRLVLWTLSGNRTAPVFILDEPFKFLSKDKTEAAADMLRGIADLLGIQVIMISHDEGLIVAADKSWTVRRGRDGTAEVMQNV